MDDAPPRLSSEMLVSALIRRVQAEGGFAAVLHRGDPRAGAIIVECTHRGQADMRIERAADSAGRDGWRLVETADPSDRQASAERLGRRLATDPDLWVIELDIALAERFAAETIAAA